MPIISAAEFSRLAGVSKVAVSKAPPTKIHKEPDGKIDTDHPVNAVYLAEHTGRAAPPAAQDTPAPKRTSKKEAAPDPEDAAFQKAVRTRQAKTERQQVLSDAKNGMDELSPQERKAVQADVKKTILDLMGDTVNLDREKKVADIALKKVLEKNHAFKLAKAKGEVISRDEFKRTAMAWNAALSQNVMRVPRRAIARLWAMARVGYAPIDGHGQTDSRDGEIYLEKELSKAVGRALEGVAGAK